jgi:hypothetical protein
MYAAAPHALLTAPACFGQLHTNCGNLLHTAAYTKPSKPSYCAAAGLASCAAPRAAAFCWLAWLQAAYPAADMVQERARLRGLLLLQVVKAAATVEQV